jgi:hypothetical protein
MAVKHFTLVIAVLLLTMGAAAQSGYTPGTDCAGTDCTLHWPTGMGGGAISAGAFGSVSPDNPAATGLTGGFSLEGDPAAPPIQLQTLSIGGPSGPSWNLGMDAGPGLFGMGAQLPGGGLGNLTNFAFRVGIPALQQAVAKSVGMGLTAIGQMLPQNIPCAIQCAVGGPNGGGTADRGPRWGTPPWRSNVGEAMAKYDTVVDAPIKNGSYYGPFGGQNGNHFIPELYDLSKGSGALSGHAGDALVEWTTKGNGQTIQQIIRSKPELAKYFIDKADRTKAWGKWAMGIEYPMKAVNGVEPGLTFPHYLLPPD